MPDATENAHVKLPMKLAEFLESTPPNVIEQILDLCEPQGLSWVIAQPDLQLHCRSEPCQGVRLFHCTSNKIYVQDKTWARGFAIYVCRNCQQRYTTFALTAYHENGSLFGRAMKFGEIPSFGPPTPSRVISLIGPDRDLCLRGRRAENEGLGIGAFAYYRRVVEKQKGRVLA